MQKFKNILTDLSRHPVSASKLQRIIHHKKNDQRLRGLGLSFLGVAVAVMAWGALNTGSSVVTASPSNDIIVGGVAANTSGLSGADYENKIKENTINGMRSGGFTADVYNYYNITEQDVLAAKLTTINTGDPSLHSVGRQYFGEVTKTNNSGQTKFYERTINSAYGGKERQVEALVGKRVKSGADGYNRYFAIILSCGNPVLNYSEELKPKIEISKTAEPATGTSVEPGQEIQYSVTFANAGSAAAKNFSISDAVPASTSLMSIPSGAERVTQNGLDVVKWASIGGGNLEVSSSYTKVGLTVKVNEDAKDGDLICNTAVASAADNIGKTSNEVCHKVVVKPPVVSICKGLYAVAGTDGTINITFTGFGGEQAESAVITRSDEKLFSDNISTNESFSLSHSLEGNQAETYDMTAYILESSGEQTTSESCSTSLSIPADCDHESRKDDESCPQEILGYHKTAQNITNENKPKTSPASSKPIKAKSGDKILYEIVYENLGQTSIKNHQPVEDDVSDLLEYAEIINTGTAVLNKFDGISELAWSETFDLEPGDRHVMQFTAQIKNNGSDCNTPTPTNSGGTPNLRSFDCVLENKYGQSTTFVELQPGISKQVQGVVAEIPKTGSGPLMLMSLAVFSAGTFSYYRTRLITSELNIAKQIHRGQR